jgi:FrmR/RcnR family transcriptional regulator, repressor of frmRAB operon
VLNFCQWFETAFFRYRANFRGYYTGLWYSAVMAHTTKEKEKLLIRVRRIRGQVEAIERALDGEHECSSVLQLMAACRGALNGLMAEVLEGHIRFHVLDPKSGKNAPQVEAAEELIDVVRTYLK